MPVPGEQFCEAVLRQVGDAGEDIGEPRLRVDVVELGTIATAGDLVEGAPGQAATGQPCVDCLDAGRQTAMRDTVGSLNLADPFTHGVEGS